MRCPLGFRGSGVPAAVLLMAAVILPACSSGESVDAESDPNAPFAIEVSQTFIAIENRAGVPIVDGEILILPAGGRTPYRTPLLRLETKGRREISMNNFRSNDGTPFSRRVTRAQTVRVTATDVLGNKHEHAVPFK